MKSLKKLFSLILVISALILCVLMVASCGGGNTDTNTNTDTSSNTNTDTDTSTDTSTDTGSESVFYTVYFENQNGQPIEILGNIGPSSGSSSYITEIYFIQDETQIKYV
jgi:hypothetical protein